MIQEPTIDAATGKPYVTLDRVNSAQQGDKLIIQAALAGISAKGGFVQINVNLNGMDFYSTSWNVPV